MSTSADLVHENGSTSIPQIPQITQIPQIEEAGDEEGARENESDAGFETLVLAGHFLIAVAAAAATPASRRMARRIRSKRWKQPPNLPKRNLVNLRYLRYLRNLRFRALVVECKRRDPCRSGVAGSRFATSPAASPLSVPHSRSVAPIIPP